jgi:hypothetical protein
VGKLKENRPLRGIGRKLEDNIKWILYKLDGALRTGLIWLRIVAVEGSCGNDNEPPGFIKCWEIVMLLSDWGLLKKDPAPWI